MEREKFLHNIFESITEKINSEGLKITDFKFIDYGFQFTVSNKEHSGMVRIYVNKKEQIRYDFSQIKNENLKFFLRNLVSEDIATNTLENKLSVSNSLNIKYNEFSSIIGTDESGKGDFFGPLVTAAVYVDDNNKNLLTKSGVKDSKKINDDKIMILADTIKKICADKYSIIEISPEKYNDLYSKFKSEKKNLNTLLAWGHAKAIEEVLNKVDCSNALSDKFADEKFILSKLQEKGKKINLRQEHKAEDNIAVAAASVLARARFLQKLKKLSTEYNVLLPKGASQKVIDQAKRFIAINGNEKLRKVAKLHFKTTKSL